MRGDHLSVHYKTFYHHGIDCGDGTVIHMSNDHGGIVHTSYEEFADGKKVYKEPTPKSFTRDQIVERAQSRVGESGYHLLMNNCEHFANWCRNGKHCSKQLKNVSKAIGKQGTKSTLKAGAKIVTEIGVKEVGKTGSKLIAKTGAKSGAKVIGKTLAKGGGAFIVADIAQAGIEQLGGNMGLSQDDAEVVGKCVGAGGHIAAGAAVAGPLGAAAGLAIWGVGELFGSLFD